METFIIVMGYILGAIIILCTAFICSARFKFIIRLLLNSILGCIGLSVANALFASFGFHVGISPVTAICVGVLGLPGALAVILLSFII